MRGKHLLAPWQHNHELAPALAVGLGIALLMVKPAPLLPVARAYRALCERYPPLTLLTFHAPPLPLVLLLTLIGIALVTGTWAGLACLIRTHRFNQRVRRNPLPLPPRLARIGADLGVADRLTYLGSTASAACCYGFVRPCIAVTTGLLEQLDDEELVAVLAHERQHLSHRDPVRYLLLHTVSAAAFIFPATSALRQRQEARIELAADRAALLVVPRGALAGALLAVLDDSPGASTGYGLADRDGGADRTAERTGPHAGNPRPTRGGQRWISDHHRTDHDRSRRLREPGADGVRVVHRTHVLMRQHPGTLAD